MALQRDMNEQEELTSGSSDSGRHSVPRTTLTNPLFHKPQHSCIWVMNSHGKDFTFLWASKSIRYILGYAQEEFVGLSVAKLVHPEDVQSVSEVRYDAMLKDKVATLCYLRLQHKSGHFVLCAMAGSIVYDKVCGSLSRAIEDPREKLRAMTAVEVIEISPESQGIFKKPKWHNTPPPPRDPDSFLLPADRDKRRIPITSIRPAAYRTFLILDRFTRDDNILYISNDLLIYNMHQYLGKSFYDLIQEDDRMPVQQQLKINKGWGTFASTGIEPSSFAYFTFKLDTGQEDPFLVQCTSATYSDGTLLVIQRIPPLIDSLEERVGHA